MEGREGHVVMYPAFGMGHFLPMVELAKRLSGHHGLKVTVLVSDWAIKPQQLAEYKNLFASNSILDIDFVELPKLEQDGNTEADFLKRTQENMVNTKPLLESALKDAKDSFPVSAFITDFFCTDIFGVPESLGIPVYVYFVSAASMLCVMLYAPELATKRPLPIKPTDTEPVLIPGLPPLMAKDLPSTFVDTAPRSKSFCEWFMGHCIRLRSAKGFLINTFAEMETVQLAALAETEKTFEYYPIGPLIKSSLFEPTAAKALLPNKDRNGNNVYFMSLHSYIEVHSGGVMDNGCYDANEHFKVVDLLHVVCSSPQEIQSLFRLPNFRCHIQQRK